MPSALYGLIDKRYVGDEDAKWYFYRFDQAVSKAKGIVRGDNQAIVVIRRYTVDFGDLTTKMSVLKRCLEGSAREILGQGRDLEAWGMSLKGKPKRVDLRGLKYLKWDGTIT